MVVGDGVQSTWDSVPAWRETEKATSKGSCWTVRRQASSRFCPWLPTRDTDSGVGEDL